MSDLQPKMNGNRALFIDIKKLVEDSRNNVAQTINAELTVMYWNIGNRINNDILNNQRAEYGKQTVLTLSRQLTTEFGKGWSVQQLQHCLHFVETFPDFQIVSTLWRQLSWSHFKTVMYLKDELQRGFYAQMCAVEQWSVRTLKSKIDGMLFERTAISKKPENLAKLEIKQLAESGSLSPDLVFKDHYVLDFLDLKDTYQEKDLETAIVQDIERFILELGVGFAFVERQKRMIIDNTDFALDLLFFHRKLNRLVAIELKLGKFKASYKGQMELYLRWLEKHETEASENQPIGLILCAEGNAEQIELMQLDKGNIKVAEYMTKHLPKALLAEKLKRFTTKAKQMIEHRE